MTTQSFFNRWILRPNENGEIQIIEKSCTKYMPLNRYLDKVGYYNIDFFELEGSIYYYSFEPEEINVTKTVIMIGKFSKGEDGLIMKDMDDADLRHLNYFKSKFFKIDQRLSS